MATIDNLEIELTANTEKAIKSIKSLATAFKTLDKASTTSGTNFKKLAGSVNEFASSVKSNIGDIERLANSLEKISKSKVSTNLASTSKALSTTKTTLEPTKETSLGKSVSVEVKPDTAVKLKEVKNALEDVNKEAEKSKSSLAKASSAMNKFKGFVAKATHGTRLFLKNLANIVKYRVIRRVMTEIAEGAKEGLKNLYAYSKAMDGMDSTHAATNLDKLASKLMQLKNTLGVTLSSLLNTFLPQIMNFFNWLIDVFEKLNETLAAMSGEKTWTRAKELTISWGDALDDDKDKLDDMKRTLMGFDEINKLDDVKDNTTSGNGVDPSDMFEEVKVSKEAKERAKKWSEWIDNVKEAWDGFLTWLKGWIKDVKDGINGFIDFMDGLNELFSSEGGFWDGFFLGGIIPNLDWHEPEWWAKFKKWVADLLDTREELKKKLQAPISIDGEIEINLKYGENGNWITDFFNKLKQANKSAGETVKQTVTGMLEDLERLNGGLEKNKGAWDNWSKDSRKGIKKVAEKLKKKLEKMEGFFEKFEKKTLKGADEYAKSIAEKLGDIDKPFMSALQRMKQEMVDTLEEMKQLSDEGKTGDKKAQGTKFANDYSELPIVTTNDSEKTMALKWEDFAPKDNTKTGVYEAYTDLMAEFEKQKKKNQKVLLLLANGGMPKTGDLFMANEAGPEMVGTMRGKTTVANNQQIVDGIKHGVMEAMTSVMAKSDKAPVIENVFKVDSETLYKITKKGEQKYNGRYNVATVF